MSKLTHCRCEDIPLTGSTFQVLHVSCKRIKSIHIEFAPDMEQTVLRLYPFNRNRRHPHSEQDKLAYGKPEISMFTNLEELTLRGMYNDLAWWTSQLVQLLRNSPGLRKLHLSLSVETVGRSRFSGNSGVAAVSFFNSLCSSYAESGASALQLTSLTCGASILPRDLALLKSLTDLRHLEEVYLSNRELFGLDIDESIQPAVAYDAFGPTHCPNLRRFAVDHARPGVHKFLSSISDRAWASQLAVSYRHGTRPPFSEPAYEPAALLRPPEPCPFSSQDNHDRSHLRCTCTSTHLPLRFRMLNALDLDRGESGRSEIKAPLTWPPILPAPPPVTALTTAATTTTAGEILDSLVQADSISIPDCPSSDPGTAAMSTNSGALQGLTVHVPWNQAVESGLGHLDFLETAVASLRGLTALVVSTGIKSFDNVIRTNVVDVDTFQFTSVGTGAGGSVGDGDSGGGADHGGDGRNGRNGGEGGDGGKSGNGVEIGDGDRMKKAAKCGELTVKGVAERLAVKGRRLRYIGVCGRYWRVWRDRDGDGRVRLEALEREEIERVELFKWGVLFRDGEV